MSVRSWKVTYYGNGKQNDYQVQYNTGGWILMSLSNALIQSDVAWGGKNMEDKLPKGFSLIAVRKNLIINSGFLYATLSTPIKP